MSRQGLRPGERMLHTEVMEQIWKKFGRAQVDLFASRETLHCPLWFSLTHPAPLGLDAMVQMWPRLRLYAFPPIALLPGFLERLRQDEVCLLLVAPYWPGRTWFADLAKGKFSKNKDLIFSHKVITRFQKTWKVLHKSNVLLL